MHVYATRKHQRLKKTAKFNLMDWLIYAVAFLSPVMTLPQVAQIWVEKNVAGVSLVTWASYTVFAAFWLTYGLIHREKPIIVANILSGILNIIIVAGILNGQLHYF